MSLTAVVSWSLVSAYKTLLGAGRDPSSSLMSQGPTGAMGKHLQHLLLSLLLLAWPAGANYPWNRMKGGGGARNPSMPYMAYLQGTNNHSCGGFLVAPSWVMTAAQCLKYNPLTVILGAQAMQSREESWQTFEVLDYHPHPDFRSAAKGNDILLLKLKGNATTTEHVRTIAFEKSKVPGGTQCSLAGWSYTTSTATLHQITVTIIKQRDCLNHNPGLADHLICGRSGSAGTPEEGDTGGPLVCNNRAYGIFSYEHPNWPGFYTHIAPYLPWVNSVMRSP
ncbi:granzyme G-like [Aegotheles albertisi]